MKNNRLKLLILVLVMFSFTFFMSLGTTKAIYRETKSTSINLSVIEAPLTYTVTFVTNNGGSVPSRNIEPNAQVGTLPILTKTDYNFVGWYDENEQKVTHTTPITRDTTLTAVWQKIVCRRVTDENNLHTETCAGINGCRTAGIAQNDIITYGNKGDGLPVVGDAYDCDVDYNGNFTTQEPNDTRFTERFYFVREDSGNAVMVYYTSIDENGRANRPINNSSINSHNYGDASALLPNNTSSNPLWDNPDLVKFDSSGRVSRFISLDDIAAVCGTPVITGTGSTNYLSHCSSWILFETSRFQSSNLGRAGIWIEDTDESYLRIQTSSFVIQAGENGANSSNMVRPVIEIPMSALEDYHSETRYTISFHTYQDDPNPPADIKRYRGEALGTLPTVTRENFEFINWYTDANYDNIANPNELVSGNMNIYAKWEGEQGVTVTLHLDGGTITGVNTQITLDSGDLLDNLPNPEKTGYNFLGWYTDSNFTIPFDDTVPITSNLDLYAKWEEIQTVTITLHLDGGTITVDSPITINSGDLLDNLPDPVKLGYTFAGWYTDSGFNNQFDDTLPITSNMDLYAKWEMGNYVARIGDNYFETLDEAISDGVDVGTTAPTVIHILKDITLTQAVSIPSNKWVELDIQNYTISSSTSNVIENSGKLNIINGTIMGSYVGTAKPNSGYVILSKSGSTLNVSGGLIKYDNTNATEAKPIQINGGTATITGGRFECNSQAATINVESGGNLYISSGEVIGTGVKKGQGIYLADASNATITGDVYISNVSTISTTNDRRAAVDNAGSGNLIITGGTIISEGLYAVNNRGSGKTYIGIEDSNGNIIDNTTPILKGNTYAINRNGGTLYVYDGVYEGQTGASSGTITKPTDVDFVQNGMDDSYKVYYLAYPQGDTYTVTFDADNGTTPTQVTGLNRFDTVGSSMPNNPTKTDYIFEKWFIYKEFNNEVLYDGEFTSTTPITDNITVKAKWKPTISTATVTPANIVLTERETITIMVNTLDGTEDYTFTSSNPNIATVDANGLVTAVAEGTTSIIITGLESNNTITIPVTINGIIYHTVTFYDVLNGTVIKTTQVEDGTQIGASGIPSNPTRNNYVFENWYVNGNTSTPAFNSSATITADTVVIANWFETVSYATLVINPNPMVLDVTDTGTITLNPTVSNEVVESYTCTSNDPSVATVNNCVVTAVAPGNTTITITGSDPLNTKTVNVTVNNIIVYHTVTFYDELNGNILKTTQVEHGTQIGASGMPASNPNKNNYVFDNWYVNGNTSVPAFNSSAIINADTVVVANWFESIHYATLTLDPNPMVLNINQTGTITLTPTVSNEIIESFSCTSNDPSVVTVNNCTLTGVGEGTTTIDIIGSDPLNPRTVNVTVELVKYTVTFDQNNGDQNAIITINNIEYGTLLSTIIPTDPTKTDHTFDNWYLVEGSTFTNTIIDPDIVITGDLEYRASFYSSNDIAAIGNTYYTDLQVAFNGATDNVETEVRLLRSFTVPTSGNVRPTINANKDIILVGGEYTVTCGKDNVIYNKGKLEILSGTYTCGYAGKGPIENETGSTLYIKGGTLTNTNNRGVIYNAGTVYISGDDTYLSSVATERSVVQNFKNTGKITISGGTIEQLNPDCQRGAIENISGGKVTITGGTIISHSTYTGTASGSGPGGIQNYGTLVIGTNGDGHNTTTPIIIAQRYGVNSSVAFEFYDGIIKSVDAPTNQDIDTKVTHETGLTKVLGTEVIDTVTYNTFYYSNGATPTPSPTPSPTPTPAETNTITFQSIGGEVSPASVEIVDGEAIVSSDLPTASWGNKTLAGWYLDENYTNPVVVGTTIPTGDTTYYAKWTYTPTSAKVTYNSTNDAIDEYFDNINSWKNLSQSDFEAQMTANFNSNSCSNCNATNSCDSPLAGNQCDKPKEYNTNINAKLDVYLYDETSHTILSKVKYASLTNGKITNLIPGLTYYWENSTNSSVNGLISANTPRRTIDAGNVRNVRDLGGLSVSYTEGSTTKTGTIKYGRLLRGAKLSSSNSDVTSLTNLGITREIDLRPSSEGSGQAKLPLVDNGSGTDIIIHNYLINNTSVTYSYKDKNGANQTTVPAYTSYAEELKSALKSTMQHIINGDNIYFHCTIGTDRTGTLAYFLEGLLGVSEEDRVEDYELTYFFGLTNRTRYHDYLSGSDINPRFTFMHLTYPSNQDILNWYTTVSPSSDDLTVLNNFRNAMIDYN